MVFLDGEGWHPVYQQHYETLKDAKRGHQNCLKKLRKQKLPLSISVNHSFAADVTKGEETP
jgi:hypothetical protein